MNADTEPQPAAPPQPRRGVLVVTDESDDPTLAAAREVAVEMATTGDVPLIFYDRSEETWGDSQHPDGPMTVDDPRLADREHLCRQMTEAAEGGVDVYGWVATLPTISAIETALSAVDVDVIVVGASGGRHLLERALIGDSLAETIAHQLDRHPQLDATIVEVDDERSATVVRVT